ncbi:MAG: HAD hydrolase-like protein [Planctomycetota bacterium]|nr:HAD hydrolase-like protein [Planctomycetota bacterium]
MMRSQGIRGWIFQLGGVLYDGTAWRRWLLDHLRKRGLHTHYRLFFRHWDLEYIPRIECGELSFQDAIENVLVRAGMPVAHIHEITPALRSKRKSLLAQERPLAGVANLLNALQAAGHRLALWSVEPCDQESIYEKATRLGLAHFFDFIAQADNAGHGHVPDRLLASTLQALRVAHPQIAFVGNTPEYLRLARMVGLQTVGVGTESIEQTDWQLQGVVQLQELLQAPQRRMAG